MRNHEFATQKDEAPGGQGKGLQETNLQKHNFSSRSTATEAQIQRLLALMKIRPHHTHELRKFGISHPAGRILDLEKRGFVFDSDRITTIDSDGYAHRGVALYALVSIPEGGVV